MIECEDDDGAMITKGGMKVYVLIQVPSITREEIDLKQIDYRVVGVYSKSEYLFESRDRIKQRDEAEYDYLETEFILDGNVSRSRRYKIDSANRMIENEDPDYWKSKGFAGELLEMFEENRKMLIDKRTESVT